MVLRDSAVDVNSLVRLFRRGEQRGEVETVGFPVLDGGVGSKALNMADHVVDGAESQARHVLPGFFGYHEEVVHNMLGQAREFLAQLGVLGGDADRAGVQVAFPHHDTPERNQGGRGEAELLRSKKSGDRYISACLELPVCLENDA